MTITSINHNPNNDTKYARHRSIWKGSRNQLKETLDALEHAAGVTAHIYHDIFGFQNAWDVDLTAGRIPPKTQGTGTWVAHDPSQKILQATPDGLRGDLRLLWVDFVVTVARRIGFFRSAFLNERDQWNSVKSFGSHAVLAFAPGPNRFDLILSKFGYGEKERGTKHHFYQWQARVGTLQGQVNVDDYEKSEDG